MLIAFLSQQMGVITNRPGHRVTFKVGHWLFYLLLASILPPALGAGFRLSSQRNTFKRHRYSRDLGASDSHGGLGDGFKKRQVSNLGSTIVFTLSSTTTVTVHMTHPIPTTEVITTTTTRVSNSGGLALDKSSSSVLIATSISSLASTTSSSETPSKQSSTGSVATSATRLSSVPEPPAFLSTSRTPISLPATSIRPSPSSVSRSSPATQSSFDPVVGAGNTCVDRMKIEDMQLKQPDSFNLLLLAWRDLQLAPESDDLSFFSLARIHGAPFGPWQMPQQGDYKWDTGYCTHHSAIFLPWHRPLLALFEQTLYRKAVAIAARFSGDARERYQTASNGVRLPYWDWSDPNTQSYLPTAVTVDTVTVVEPGPDGNPITTNIPNPLNAYTFQSRNSTSTFWGNFATWPTTLRQPDASGASRNDLANATLQNTYSNRHQATYLAFSYTSFNDFSVSLEALHDEVHSSIGGVGHMTYIPYSSYDPVFWLHHSNMDRLMAMYQAAKADTFIQPLSSVATFANLNSQLDTVETPLYPFRRFDGSFWTSQDVSSASTIFPLSYGYPEVPCLMTFTTFDALRNHTTTEVNRLYAPKPASPTKRSVDTNAIRKEWQAKVTIDQSELRGTFVVYFFFGKPPAHSSLWPTSASMIGSFARLGSPGVQMQPEVVGSNVILTDALHKALTVSSPQDQILSFLKHNLTWMVLSDNEPVDIRSLKTLKIACVSTEIALPVCADQLPQRGRDTYHLEATAGKPGGAASDCDLKRSHT